MVYVFIASFVSFFLLCVCTHFRHKPANSSSSIFINGQGKGIYKREYKNSPVFFTKYILLLLVLQALLKYTLIQNQEQKRMFKFDVLEPLTVYRFLYFVVYFCISSDILVLSLSNVITLLIWVELLQVKEVFLADALYSLTFLSGKKALCFW
jgi:hypothetical protein